MRPRLAGLLVAGTLVAGCGASASPESGITALLRASNAQFVAGPLAPDTSAMGTAVIGGVAINNTTVYPGEVGFSLSGTVNGTTAFVGLTNDAGYWILPAQIPDLASTDGFTFTTQLSFSPTLPLGSQTLALRGVAADGTVGPAQLYKLTVVEPDPAPTGALVVSLNWDTESDLDLHVIIPNAADATMPIELWNKHPVPPQPFGAIPDPAVLAMEPYLDFDSNGNCTIDGRRQENVVFPTGSTPPSGEYTVLVDAASLCGQADAQWTVTSTLADGTLLGFAQWEATDADTRGPHTAGSGRLAFTFTIQ